MEKFNVIELFGGECYRIKEKYNCDFDAINETIDTFLKEHKHEGWNVSIYDTNTQNTIEIVCDTSNITEVNTIIHIILNEEKGLPFSFIAENPITESIVVGFPLCRGRFNHKAYKYVDGRFE